MEIAHALFPEISILTLGLLLIVVKLLVGRYGFKAYGHLSAIWILGTLVAMMALGPAQQAIGLYYTDLYATFFKGIILLTAFLVVLGSISYVKKLGYYEAEYYILLSFALLGMLMFSAAGDLVVLYMGLELMTISFVILVGFLRRDNLSTEGAVKYLVLGSMSSALMLFGMSYLYGYFGTTVFADAMASFAGGAPTTEPVFLLGILLFLAGFAFKVSAVPFHMWAPDIYQGAPAPVAGFLAVGSKAAALAVMMRVFLVLLPSFYETWQPVLIAMALLSIVLGNLIAIPQTNVKRMLAYSSIAQVGYLLLGIISAGLLGAGALMYYVTAYVFANVGAFLVVTAIEEHTGKDDREDYAGMSKRAPFLAASMFVFMVSLGGLPPLGGFIGKFLLFTGLMNAHLIWLAVVGLVFSMISVYYYFHVTRAMYVTPADEATVASKFHASLSTTIALVICIVMSIVLGIFFGPIIEIVMSCAHQMMLPM